MSHPWEEKIFTYILIDKSGHSKVPADKPYWAILDRPENVRNCRNLTGYGSSEIGKSLLEANRSNYERITDDVTPVASTSTAPDNFNLNRPEYYQQMNPFRTLTELTGHDISDEQNPSQTITELTPAKSEEGDPFITQYRNSTAPDNCRLSGPNYYQKNNPYAKPMYGGPRGYFSTYYPYKPPYYINPLQIPSRRQQFKTSTQLKSKTSGRNEVSKKSTRTTLTAIPEENELSETTEQHTESEISPEEDPFRTLTELTGHDISEEQNPSQTITELTPAKSEEGDPFITQYRNSTAPDNYRLSGPNYYQKNNPYAKPMYGGPRGYFSTYYPYKPPYYINPLQIPSRRQPFKTSTQLKSKTFGRNEVSKRSKNTTLTDMLEEKKQSGTTEKHTTSETLPEHKPKISDEEDVSRSQYRTGTAPYNYKLGGHKYYQLPNSYAYLMYKAPRGYSSTYYPYKPPYYINPLQISYRRPLFKTSPQLKSKTSGRNEISKKFTNITLTDTQKEKKPSDTTKQHTISETLPEYKPEISHVEDLSRTLTELTGNDIGEELNISETHRPHTCNIQKLTVNDIPEEGNTCKTYTISKNLTELISKIPEQKEFSETSAETTLTKTPKGKELSKTPEGKELSKTLEQYKILKALTKLNSKIPKRIELSETLPEITLPDTPKDKTSEQKKLLKALTLFNSEVPKEKELSESPPEITLTDTSKEETPSETPVHYKILKKNPSETPAQYELLKALTKVTTEIPKQK